MNVGDLVSVNPDLKDDFKLLVQVNEEGLAFTSVKTYDDGKWVGLILKVLSSAEFSDCLKTNSRRELPNFLIALDLPWVLMIINEQLFYTPSMFLVVVQPDNIWNY